MKTQVVLPDTLVEALKRVVPIRKRSRFIADAVEAKLKTLNFQQALKTATGCWTDKAHPNLKTQTDVNRYLARFRGRFRRHG